MPDPAPKARSCAPPLQRRTSAAGLPRWLRVVLQYAAGLALLGLFLRQIDPAQLLAHVRRLNAAPVLIALMAYALDFLLRAVRFWLLLNAASGRKLPWKGVPGPFVASFGISDLLPLRAGDVFRLLWFRQRMQLPGGTVLGAMVIERGLDLASLLLLGTLVLAAFAPGLALLLTAAMLLAGGLVLPLLARDASMPAARRSSQGWRARLTLGARDALATFRILRSPRFSAGLGALSLVCWVLESLVLLCVWIDLGGAPDDPFTPVAGFVAATLATLVPSLPGHFGTFELLGLETFQRLGVSPGFAAAVLLVGHLLLWAPTALFAAAWLALARSPRGSGQVAQHAEKPLAQG